MAAFLASPVWGAIIGILGSMLMAIFAMVWRMSTKLSGLSDDVGDLKTDIAEIKKDPNVMRWSDMHMGAWRRRRRGF